MFLDALNWLKEFFGSIVDWALSLLTLVLEWVLDLLDWIPKTIFAEIMDALASALEAIPAPSFVTNAGSYFSALPPSIVYFLDFFAVAEGLSMIIAALIIRFVLRRIPFIG